MGRVICNEAPPPKAAAKSPVCTCFMSGVHGEWSETTIEMVRSASPRHSRSAFAASRMGGAVLNSVAPSGTSSAVRARVVETLLCADPDAVPLGPGQQGHTVRAGQVQDVRPPPCVGGGFDDGADGDVLDLLGTAGQEVGVLAGGDLGERSISPASSACTISRASSPASTASAARICATSTGGYSGSPVLARKHLKPMTPASWSPATFRAVVRSNPGPEAHVDAHPAPGPRALNLQGRPADRHRHAVQRHVHQRGDSAGSHHPGGALEVLPLGVARVLQVDVGVDQARDQDLVRSQVHDPVGVESRRTGLDDRDPSRPNAHGVRRGRFTVDADDGAVSVDHQVEGGHSQEVSVQTSPSVDDYCTLGEVAVNQQIPRRYTPRVADEPINRSVDLGPNIRARRTEHGLSLRELARRVGVSASALSQIENGHSRPSVDTLYALARALGVTPDEIFFGTPTEVLLEPSTGPEPSVVHGLDAHLSEVLELVPRAAQQVVTLKGGEICRRDRRPLVAGRGLLAHHLRSRSGLARPARVGPACRP